MNGIVMSKLSRSQERLAESGDYSLVTEAQCGSSKAKIFFVSIISFVVALIIVLLVVVIKVDTRFGRSTPNPEKPDCIDIAIIGAGLSGTYAAWRLRNEKLRISVYEMNEQAGGRILTSTFPQVPEILLELGAPHFNPAKQPKLLELTELLGLELKSSTYWEHENNTQYHLRGTNISLNELNMGNVPYNFKKDEQKSPYDLLSYISLLRKAASPEAFRYLHDTIERHLMDTLGNAAILGHLVEKIEEIPQHNNSFNVTSTTSEPTTYLPTTTQETQNTTQPYKSPYEGVDGYYTIQHGMDVLPKMLISQFVTASIQHRFMTSYFLLKIEAEDGSYQLYFNQTNQGDVIPVSATKSPVCAKKVIFAIPPESLEKVESVAVNSKQVKNMLSAQHRVQSLDIALLYNTSAFNHTITSPLHTRTDLPVTRVTHFHANQTETVNADLQNYTIFHVTSQASDAQYLIDAANEEFKFSGNLPQTSLNFSNETSQPFLDLLLKYVGDIYNITDLPRPHELMLHRWDPMISGSAWHVWKPYVNWAEVTENIKRPSNSHDIFVVGSAFVSSNDPNNMQNAITSVDALLNDNRLLQLET